MRKIRFILSEWLCRLASFIKPKEPEETYQLSDFKIPPAEADRIVGYGDEN